MRHVQSLVWGLEVECLGFSVVSKAWFGGWRSKIEGLRFRVTEIFACSLDTDEQFPHRGEGADYTRMEDCLMEAWARAGRQVKN